MILTAFVPENRPAMKSAKLVLCMMIALAGPAAAQGAKTVQDGVYNKAQAQRGVEAFQANCSACHGFDMNGTEGAPRLVGGLFMLHWGDKPASEVFAMMRAKMPPSNPGGLPDETYVDILSAIFQANQFPPSETATLTAQGLKDIIIKRKTP